MQTETNILVCHYKSPNMQYLHVFVEPIHPRLAVAKVLGKAEDTYLSNIQLLLDSYGDPLK